MVRASPRESARRRWRHYETAAGRRPVLEFIRGVSDLDKAAILAAMKEVRQEGTRAARHLTGDIYEVRADGERVIYRVLFAGEGRQSQVLLALVQQSLLDSGRQVEIGLRRRAAKTVPDQLDLAD